MYFVYVLKSDVDYRLYKGLTKDLDRRIKEHNRGYCRSTRQYRPWTLVFSEKVDTLSDARVREKYYKSGIGRERLKTILDS